DRALGRILEQAGSDASVYVLASHGMGPHYDATFLLAEILRRLRDAGRSALRPSPPAAEVAGSQRYFEVPNNDVYGGIRINLAGREPAGWVRPGAELDARCGELRRGAPRARELGTRGRRLE